MPDRPEMKVGNFLVENKIITREQLEDALLMQKDNPGVRTGEILVTQGVLSKEQLIMSLEMYLMVTGILPEHFSEWLDQEEVDMLMNKLSNDNDNKKSS